MARIRTIKPEFPQSESIGAVSRDARLLFIQLWTVCDDYGRCRANARLLSGQLYPYDVDAVTLLPGWLAELEAGGLVVVYQVEGSTYLEVLGWGKHQRVDNAGKPTIPPRPERQATKSAEIRREPPRTAETLSGPPLDLGPRTKDLGIEVGTNVPTRPISDEIERAEAGDPKKAKRNPVPFAAIVDLYHEVLPELPRLELLTDARRGQIRQRWGEHMPALDDWRNFFTHVRGSPFLMGRAPPQPGKPPFRADLEWLTKAANFAKIAEGKYHR